MEIKVRENSDMVAVLEVKGVGPSFLNSLRRTLLSQVPKLAIDDVTIYDNTSALFDEMVAHRLGLLPVPTDLNAFNRREGCPTCNGEGCSSCTVLFTLSKEGPAMVLSGDLVPAADAKFRIVDPKVPIVKLLEGQRVMLEAGAVLGTGAEHAKWQAVTAIGYTEFPHVKVGQLSPQVLERVQRTMPPGALAIEGSTVKVIDGVRAATFLHSIKELYPDAPIEITRETDHWIVTLETDGSLSPVTALRHAVAMLMEKLKLVEAETPKLKLPEQAA
jgi:DNA-directed RNA polymerase subunit D